MTNASFRNKVLKTVAKKGPTGVDALDVAKYMTLAYISDNREWVDKLAGAYKTALAHVKPPEDMTLDESVERHLLLASRLADTVCHPVYRQHAEYEPGTRNPVSSFYLQKS